MFFVECNILTEEVGFWLIEEIRREVLLDEYEKILSGFRVMFVPVHGDIFMYSGSSGA